MENQISCGEGSPKLHHESRWSVDSRLYITSTRVEFGGYTRERTLPFRRSKVVRAGIDIPGWSGATPVSINRITRTAGWRPIARLIINRGYAIMFPPQLGKTCAKVVYGGMTVFDSVVVLVAAATARFSPSFVPPECSTRYHPLARSCHPPSFLPRLRGD